MCWPLTRRGGHTATTKETERPPPPGGPVGAKRRNDRGRSRSEAARGHDRRSPPVESQGDGRMRTGTGPETTSGSRSSPARHGRADSTDEARRKRSYAHSDQRACACSSRGKLVRWSADIGGESMSDLDALRRPAGDDGPSRHGIAAERQWTCRTAPVEAAGETSCQVIGGEKSLRCATD
jgi:hypothetical protein